MVPEKDKSDNISSHQMWKFLNWNISKKNIYDSSWQRKEVLGTCHVDMSICRCDSMWWQPLFGISGAWLAFFSPQSSRRSAMDTERNAIWTPQFIIVHHSSSRIQELSPDIHVPCYGHTGHTQYVSFFTGPSWWRYWETSRILCMMLSTLKNRTVIGDHHPILLDRSVCNHHLLYLLTNLGTIIVIILDC